MANPVTPSYGYLLLSYDEIQYDVMLFVTTARALCRVTQIILGSSPTVFLFTLPVIWSYGKYLMTVCFKIVTDPVLKEEIWTKYAV